MSPTSHSRESRNLMSEVQRANKQFRNFRIKKIMKKPGICLNFIRDDVGEQLR